MDAAASSSEAPAGKRRRKEASEPVLDAINAGRDPHWVGASSEHTWLRASAEQLDGISCGDGEQRLYIISDAHLNDGQIARYFPARTNRETNCNHLISWELLKLVPPAFYIVAFTDTSSGKLRAVSEAKRSLDGYPQAGGPSDPEKKAGFTKKSDLRLVLRPTAIRFFQLGLHEPLRVANAWPSARDVMMDGYRLQPAARAALAAKLSAIPVDPSTAWHKELRATLARRHWPAEASLAAAPPPPDDAPPAAAAADAPPPAAEAPAPVEQRAVQVERVLTHAPMAGHDDPERTISDTLLVADTYRARVERATRPDISLRADEFCPQRPLLYGCMWAYDLDSTVLLDDVGEDAPSLGFGRILQISPTCGPVEPADPPEVTVRSPHPPWADALASWYCKSFRFPGERTPIVHAYECLRGDAFWRMHECREWQLSVPVVMDSPCHLCELHDLLTGGLLGRLYYTVLSSSLQVSAWEMLGFGDDPAVQPVDALYESGTYGQGDQWHAKLRGLLPFYESMRKRERESGSLVIVE